MSSSTTPPSDHLPLESTEFRLRQDDILSPGNEACSSHSTHTPIPSPLDVIPLMPLSLASDGSLVVEELHDP